MAFSALSLIATPQCHTGSWTDAVVSLSGVDWMRIGSAVAVAAIFGAVVWGGRGAVLAGALTLAVVGGMYIYVLSLPGGGWAMS